jgi:hypothetical protein
VFPKSIGKVPERDLGAECPFHSSLVTFGAVVRFTAQIWLSFCRQSLVSPRFRTDVAATYQGNEPFAQIGRGFPNRHSDFIFLQKFLEL